MATHRNAPSEPAENVSPGNLQYGSRKPIEDSGKSARILLHMNSQPAMSLSRYLRYYGNRSSFAARSPQAVAITPSAITIVAQGLVYSTRHTIPFSPPLSSLDEARERLVAMDQKALKALGQSPETVTRYVAPTPVQVCLAASVLFGFFCFARAENFLPDSWLTRTVLRFAPGFARLCYSLHPLGLVLMVGIHLVEGAVMARSKLAPHGVPVGSRVWVLWVVSAFCEGMGALKRFNGEVKRLREKSEASVEKH